MYEYSYYSYYTHTIYHTKQLLHGCCAGYGAQTRSSSKLKHIILAIANIITKWFYQWINQSFLTERMFKNITYVNRTNSRTLIVSRAFAVLLTPSNTYHTKSENHTKFTNCTNVMKPLRTRVGNLVRNISRWTPHGGIMTTSGDLKINYLSKIHGMTMESPKTQRLFQLLLLW